MAPPKPSSFEQALRRTAHSVEAALDAALPINLASRLQSAMRYALMGQGKRLRPFFVLESCKLHGVDGKIAMAVAVALEFIHTYSLVHEDLPQLKTGALFEFACTAGPIIAGADISALKIYSRHIGLAFQIADDALDVEATPEALGKATQKDKRKGKATFVDLLGLEGAKTEARRLANAAIAALDPYDGDADILREAALFMVMRRK